MLYHEASIVRKQKVVVLQAFKKSSCLFPDFCFEDKPKSAIGNFLQALVTLIPTLNTIVQL